MGSQGGAWHASNPGPVQPPTTSRQCNRSDRHAPSAKAEGLFALKLMASATLSHVVSVECQARVAPIPNPLSTRTPGPGSLPGLSLCPLLPLPNRGIQPYAFWAIEGVANMRESLVLPEGNSRGQPLRRLKLLLVHY